MIPSCLDDGSGTGTPAELQVETTAQPVTRCTPAPSDHDPTHGRHARRTMYPPLVDHLSGLNSSFWCMMSAPENEGASAELSVADCVNLMVRTRERPPR